MTPTQKFNALKQTRQRLLLEYDELLQRAEEAKKLLTDLSKTEEQINALTDTMQELKDANDIVDDVTI